jgi:gamma-glutamyltranspeptidase/glutathione hydrolase
VIADWAPITGGAQAIAIDRETGVFAGGADPRREGYAAGY